MMIRRILALAATCLLPCLAEPPTYLPPNNNYLPPSSSPSFSLSAPSSSYSSITSDFSSPSSGYSAPSRSYGAPKPVYSAPKVTYSAPKPVYMAPKPVYSAPKTYLPPAPVYSAPKPVYGAPSHHDDYHSEPAHYEYQYSVLDSHYGTDFGHKEARQGDVTTGQYMVLLPDGRRQIVDYIADKHGYRPTIRYEGVAKTGGYPSGGYSSGGYP